MKTKVIILSLLLALVTEVSSVAQYSDLYYHRVGDTIEMRSPIGYYSWWEWESFKSDKRFVSLNTIPGDTYSGENLEKKYGYERMLRFYTPVPIKIIGIAGSFKGINDEPDHQEYLRIYDATPSGHPLLAQAAWHINDPCRYLHLSAHGDGPGVSCCPPGLRDSCCGEWPWEYIVSLNEYYFDTAFYVTDSFYVGGTYFCSNRLHPDDGTTLTRYWGACITKQGYQCGDYPQRDFECSIIGMTHMYRWGVNDNWKWRTDLVTDGILEGMPWVELIFPLIQVDTTVPPEGVCVPVENVQVMPMADSSVLVTWDGFPNYTAVELSYGPRNIPEYQWTVVNVVDSLMYNIRVLNPAFPFYGVKVRAICGDEKTPTPWSDKVWFQFETGQEGIGGGEGLLSQGVFISPNPVTEVLTVASSFSLRHIDIYNANGQLVYSESASGHDVSIPVGRDYLPGVYLMEIVTQGGTTHKKFVKM